MGRDAATLMTITVPQGVNPGQAIQVQTPAGATVQATVPAGVFAGQTFQISVPAAGTVAMVTMPGALNTQAAAPTGSGINVFASMPDIFIKQTRKGCLQEMMGCDANSEFIFGTRDHQPKAAPMGLNGPQGPPVHSIFYAVETASFFMRYFCSNMRPSTLGMFMGKDDTGAKVMSYDRPYRFAAGSCKVCCFQEMSFFDEKQQPIGMIKEPCYMCVPYHTIFDESEQPQFRVQMPTCCGGMCVDCCAEGCCNMRIPFYIYPADGDMDTEHALLGKTPKTDPKSSRNGSMYAQITKVWAGGMTELYTDSDNFEVEFPASATAKQKALLVGSVFFLNMLYFERQKQ